MTHYSKCLQVPRLCKSAAATLAALLTVVSATNTTDAQQPPGPRERQNFNRDGEFVELNRGPVHEAFAQPYEMKSGGNFVVKQQPPQPIDEVPPSQVPQSSEYDWIPGYWGWEPAEERFIWISGIWRKAPEEMTWNPGYWTRVENGYAWVSGCWVRNGELYLISKTPPDPKRQDPGQPPSPQHFWVPGFWDYENRNFTWLEGFWARGIEDRVWVPARYLWTPRGWLAVDGYWDYPLDERGILFSPVAFQDIPNPGYRYTPRMVVRTTYLPTHLFVYNRYGHYCYGDYYGYNPGRGRFYPWAQANTGFYDPLRIFLATFQRNRFNYYRQRHNYYRDHADFRPRHLWRDQQQFLQQGGADVNDALLSVGLNQLLDGDQDGIRTRVRFDENQERWNREIQRNQRLRELRERREKAFGSLKDGRQDESSEINLGDFRIKVNPQQIPNVIDGRRGRSGSKGENADSRTRGDARPDTDPKDIRPRNDRDSGKKRAERRLPDPRDRGRETPAKRPGRPQVPERPGRRPDTSERPKLPKRPDLPDRPEKPQKPNVPEIKPGKRPQPKDIPGKAKGKGKTEKPDLPGKKPGNPVKRIEKPDQNIN